MQPDASMTSRLPDRIVLTTIHPAIPDRVAETTSATPQSLACLTAREKEVLVLIADGCSTKEIAFRLGMSFKTAACHRYNIMSKLSVSNAPMLVRLAIRHGLVQP